VIIKIRKGVVAGFLAALAMFAVFLVSPTAAQAVGGSCTSTRQSRAGSIPGTTEYRSAASCSALNSDSRARAKLIRNLGPDYTGSYFTALNVWKYTGYYTCYSGCSDAYEIAHR
jgi:hypothetical protein